jgi:hypothetical protein
MRGIFTELNKINKFEDSLVRRRWASRSERTGLKGKKKMRPVASVDLREMTAVRESRKDYSVKSDAHGPLGA